MIAWEPTVRAGELVSLVDLAPGIYANVPPELYYRRELGVASKSALDLLAKAPAKYHAWVRGLEERETAALRFGRAFHTCCLEPEDFVKRYAIEPVFGDLRTKGPKDAREKWRADHPDVEYLSASEGELIRGMAIGLHGHPTIRKLLRHQGAREVTLRWDDQATGIPCKGRADWHVPGLRLALDLKTAEAAHFDAFRYAVESYAYHRQDAFYREGFAGAGEPVDAFVFVAVEKSPPYLPAIYQLDEEDVRAGTDENRELLGKLATCLAKNDWPGYPANIQTVKMRPWALVKGAA